MPTWKKPHSSNPAAISARAAALSSPSSLEKSMTGIAIARSQVCQLGSYQQLLWNLESRRREDGVEAVKLRPLL
jgi:hypothetical protein